MENMKVEKLKKQFNKNYKDVTKHYGDIERWIKLGSRKQGDIRRSIEGLTHKYNTLNNIKEELGKDNISETDLLNNISETKTNMNLTQLREKINYLYNLAGLASNEQTQSEKDKHKEDKNNDDEIELKYDTVFLEYRPRNINKNKAKKSLSKKNRSNDDEIELTNNEAFLEYRPRDMNNNRVKKSLPEKDKNENSNNEIELKHDLVFVSYSPKYMEDFKTKGFFSKMKDKLKNTKEKIKKALSKPKSSKTKNKNSKKTLLKRVAALAMATSVAVFGKVTAGEKNVNLENENNNKSYTDVNNEKDDFKDSIYMQALEPTQPTIEEDEQIDDKDDVYLAHANTQYTEVSDGSGSTGYFSKDTKVKVYNRALIKTEKDGSQKILRATNVGQTWKEFAEEKGIDYDEFKEYLENNKNIQEKVSIQSEDEKELYGWVSIDDLEQIEPEQETER